jgi:hypothetical protein
VWKLLGGGGLVKGDRRVVGYEDLDGAIVVVVIDICVFDYEAVGEQKYSMVSAELPIFCP